MGCPEIFITFVPVALVSWVVLCREFSTFSSNPSPNFFFNSLSNFFFELFSILNTLQTLGSKLTPSDLCRFLRKMSCGLPKQVILRMWSFPEKTATAFRILQKETLESALTQFLLTELEPVSVFLGNSLSVSCRSFVPYCFGSHIMFVIWFLWTVFWCFV